MNRPWIQTAVTRRSLAIAGGVLALLMGIAFLTRSGKRPPGPAVEPTYQLVPYHSGTLSFVYPDWWMLSESPGEVVIANELGTARVILISSEAATALPVGAIKEALLRDPLCDVAEFTLMPGDHPAYWANGSRSEGGRRMLFTEIGFEAGDKRYRMRAEDETGGYDEMLASVAGSMTITHE